MEHYRKTFISWKKLRVQISHVGNYVIISEDVDQLFCPAGLGLIICSGYVRGDGISSLVEAGKENWTPSHDKKRICSRTMISTHPAQATIVSIRVRSRAAVV